MKYLITLLLCCAFILTDSFAQSSLSEKEKSLILDGKADEPMRVFLITQYDDSLLLRTPSQPVKADSSDTALKHFIKRLYATVTDSASLGVGIAAPQVGLLRQIIWVQRFDKAGFPFEVYLNPRIMDYTRLRQEGLEGCLSIPDRRDSVNRGYAIMIEYDKLDGSHHYELVEDFTAVIFQHEIDHLDGILYTDHVSEEISQALAGNVLRGGASRGSASADENSTPLATDRWQQRISYEMEIDFDVNTHRFTGTQKIVYKNNSPDTLNQVFYHLYFNAFQPGSMMDMRSINIEDADKRVGDRISKLSPEEIGYHRINKLLMNGQATDFEVDGSILQVALPKPILPGQSASFDMAFDSQVPVQIRRSGRDNKEGIDYSMAQWYPKMCEYDYEGWHSNPYIGREFHGVWGDFDVKISIDSSYVIGGSGYLQNPQEIGHGYTSPEQMVNRPSGDKLTWHFKAPNVHDFMWAADPDYIHTQAQVPDGPTLHFFYQGDTLTENWENLPGLTVKTFQLMNERFGKYPYEQYSVIQGGDGGMEYPMATLVTGHRSFGSLVSVTVHEAIHSWFQMVLGTNESLYPWMDEGFTSYAQDEIINVLADQNSLNPHAGDYLSYLKLVEDGKVEPMSTHSDHYQTNRAYGTNAYSRGGIFLHQLSYIIGEDNLAKGMRRYYKEWQFKHPNMTDFKRVMEKQSGLELDWYFEHWIYTTNTIDYSILEISKDKRNTQVKLGRSGAMPMPIDLLVELKDGSKHIYHIPLRIMRGEKPDESGWYTDAERHVLKDWPWTNPEYEFELDIPRNQIERVVIDPTYRMADINRKDNFDPPSKEYEKYGADMKK